MLTFAHPRLPGEAIGEEEPDPPLGIDVVDVDVGGPIGPETHRGPLLGDEAVSIQAKLKRDLSLSGLDLDDEPLGSCLVLSKRNYRQDKAQDQRD
jgi:hypothetical protein